LPGHAIDLNVGVVPQGAPIDGLIGEILDILGVGYGPLAPDSTCVIDTRARVAREGPAGMGRPNPTVYFDDFLPTDELLFSLQGRPGIITESHAEPKLSAGASRLFQSIRSHFWARDLPCVTKSYWPQDAPGCLVLTHDVDWLDYSPAHRAVMKGKAVHRYVGLLYGYAVGKRFGPNIDYIIQLETSLGVRSTFLFRNEYPSAQERLPEAIRVCRASGSEIALHAAKKSHKNPTAMVREKSDMEKAAGAPLHGLREHALKFEYDKTWRSVEGAGFAYDMTFGLNEKTGFVGGLCHPYHPVALDGVRHSFLEIPTSLMDWTVVRNGMSYKGLVSLIRQLKDSTASLNGCLCVNFHNTYVDKDLFPGIERAYRLLISECMKAGFWNATAKECAEWWTRRERCLLKASMQDGSLHIEFGDPAVRPKVYWPDGRSELWAPVREVGGR